MEDTKSKILSRLQAKGLMILVSLRLFASKAVSLRKNLSYKVALPVVAIIVTIIFGFWNIKADSDASKENNRIALMQLKALAEFGKTYSDRATAITDLGRTADSTMIPFLKTLESDRSITDSERELANDAQRSIYLRSARAFYTQGRNEAATKHFRKALRYVNRDQLSSRSLRAAEIYCENNNYDQAAEMYNSLFEGL